MELLNPKLKEQTAVETDDQGVDRARQADVLLRFLSAAKNVDALHGKSVQEIFSAEENKRELIENLTPKEFIDLLNGINGILRNKKKEDWSMDGDGVMLSSAFLGLGYYPPQQEDKSKLLGVALIAAKEMNTEGRELSEIALLISSSLNAIHPYSDANGRTSRLLHFLLTENLSAQTEQELAERLLKYGRLKVNIDPGIIQAELDELVREEIGLIDEEKNPEHVVGLWRVPKKRGEVLPFNKKVTLREMNLFAGLYKRDPQYLFFAVYKYLENNPKKAEYQVKTKQSDISLKNYFQDSIKVEQEENNK